jgi:type IV secretion system protein VirB6
MNTTAPFIVIDSYVEALTTDVISLEWAGDIVRDLKVIVIVSITIYVLYKGYLILAGKTQEPIRDLMWDLCGKAFIICALYGADTWVIYVKDMVKAFFNWAMNYGDSAGMNGLITNFGIIFDNVGKINEEVMNSITKTSNRGIDYPLFMSVGYLSATIGISIPFLIYIGTKISIFFMITLAPIVIFLRLYGFSKNIFAQWLKIVLSTLLTVLLLGAIVGNASHVIIAFQNFYLTPTSDGYANPFEYLTQFSIYSLLMVFLAKICVSVSQSLVQVSLESAGMNAATGTFSNISMASRFGGRNKSLEGMAQDVTHNRDLWNAGQHGGSSGSLADMIGKTAMSAKSRINNFISGSR